MKKICAVVGISMLIFNAMGCSVFMAAKQPGKKNLQVLERGTPRGDVIAELGQPVYTKTEDGKTCDVHAFVQGYSTGAKVGRTVFHGVADVATLGLWEIFGTPIEVIADGSPVKIEVKYDDTNRVLLVRAMDGGDELKNITSYSKSN